MDISKYKEKLGDEMFAELEAGVQKLVGQRDAAVNEQITGRKGMKAENEALKAFQTKALEKLGLDAPEDLDTMPDAKGAAEAAKQFDSKLKRLERMHGEEKLRADTAESKFRDTLKRAAVAEAIGGHEFLERDIVESYVGQRLTWEGDDLLFKSDDGKLIPVKDGVAGLAKTRPGLLKPTGTGGAGANGSKAAGGGGGKTMTRSEWDAIDHTKRAEFSRAGGKVVSD